MRNNKLRAGLYCTSQEIEVNCGAFLAIPSAVERHYSQFVYRVTLKAVDYCPCLLWHSGLIGSSYVISNRPPQ